jgi:hypothetical protein
MQRVRMCVKLVRTPAWIAGRMTIGSAVNNNLTAKLFEFLNHCHSNKKLWDKATETVNTLIISDIILFVSVNIMFRLLPINGHDIVTP